MHKLALVFILAFTLCGCANPIKGKVSSAVYSNPPALLSFTVIPPDTLSLTDRNITMLIEKKMIERSYVKADPPTSASVAVIFKYSIGTGKTSVSSSPDLVHGGQQVESYTSYPRKFEIIIVDLKKSTIPEKLELIWQGELYSRGSTENISEVSKSFIDVLFDNYGVTVTNKSFSKYFNM